MFDNIGKKSYHELLEACAMHGVILYGIEDLNDVEHGIEFWYSEYSQLFDKGIKSKQDVKKRSLDELKEISADDKNLYSKLRKLKVVLCENKKVVV